MSRGLTRTTSGTSARARGIDLGADGPAATARAYRMEPTSSAGVYARRLDSPLMVDRLSASGQITDAQHGAGIGLLMLLEAAGISPGVTHAWGQRTDRTEGQSPRQARAEAAYHDAMRAIPTCEREAVRQMLAGERPRVSMALWLPLLQRGLDAAAAHFAALRRQQERELCGND